MSQPFLGQIATFAFNFAPTGWAFCNGQVLPINQNTALFSLLGTTYGGNGTTTFQLPNLQGRAPVMNFDGDGLVLGAIGGEQSHTLVLSEMPAHAHGVEATSSLGNELTAPGNLPAVVEADAYSTGAPTTTLGAGMSTEGSSQAHQNMQPYLVVNFCIALQGVFPSRN
jgi:microcystin-dependent protein